MHFHNLPGSLSEPNSEVSLLLSDSNNLYREIYLSNRFQSPCYDPECVFMYPSG